MQVCRALRDFTEGQPDSTLLPAQWAPMPTPAQPTCKCFYRNQVRKRPKQYMILKLTSRVSQCEDLLGVDLEE